MADAFSGGFSAAWAATKSLGGVLNTSAQRVFIYECGWGTESTPADQAAQFAIQRFDGTGAGTATDGTPIPIGGGAAAVADIKENYTVEPTTLVTGHLFRIGANQRASFLWKATPGKEFVIPATANAVISLRTLAVSGGTPTVDGYFSWEE